MNGMNARRQAAVLTRTRRQRPTVPRIKAARGDFEQSAHHPHRVAGLVRLHESEQRFGVAVLSFAIPKPRLLTKSPARSRAVGSHVADVSAPPALPSSGRHRHDQRPGRLA